MVNKHPFLQQEKTKELLSSETCLFTAFRCNVGRAEMPWTKSWKTENVVLPRIAMSVVLKLFLTLKAFSPMKQCAALNTHSLLIRAAPQR